MTPVCDKETRNNEINYCLVSILLNLLKIFENILYKQISEFFENILFEYQTDFQKGISTQNCLFTMIEKIRICLDHGVLFLS